MSPSSSSSTVDSMSSPSPPPLVSNPWRRLMNMELPPVASVVHVSSSSCASDSSKLTNGLQLGSSSSFEWNFFQQCLHTKTLQTAQNMVVFRPFRALTDLSKFGPRSLGSHFPFSHNSQQTMHRCLLSFGLPQPRQRRCSSQESRASTAGRRQSRGLIRDCRDSHQRTHEIDTGVPLCAFVSRRRTRGIACLLRSLLALSEVPFFGTSPKSQIARTKRGKLMDD